MGGDTVDERAPRTFSAFTRVSRSERLVLTQAILALLALSLFQAYETEISARFSSPAALAKAAAKRRAKEAAAARAASGSGGTGGGFAGPPPELVSPLHARYLVLADPDTGRFSHSRMALAEAMGLAAHAGRTLLSSSFTRGCASPLDRLFHTGNLGHGITLVDDGLFPDLRGLCGPGGAASAAMVWLDESPIYAEALRVRAAATAASGGGAGKGGGGAKAGGAPAAARAPRQLKKKNKRGGSKGGGGRQGGIAPAAAAAAAAAPASTATVAAASTGARVAVDGVSVGAPAPDEDGTVNYRNVKWTLIRSSELPAPAGGFSGVAADGSAFNGTLTDGWAEESPWVDLFPPAFRARVPQYAPDPTLPARLAALPHKCVAVHSLFHSVAWAALPPGSFEGVGRSMEPAPGLEAVVRHWFSDRGLPQHGTIGLHLRLRASAPIVAGTPGAPASARPLSPFASACADSPDAVLAALALVQRRRLEDEADVLDGGDAEGGEGGSPPGSATSPAALLNGTTLLVATDDTSHPCYTRVTAAFPGAVVLVASEGVMRDEECAEASFQQEVLARTAGFVGVGSSMFSTTVHWVRTLRFGYPPESTVFL